MWKSATAGVRADALGDAIGAWLAASGWVEYIQHGDSSAATARREQHSITRSCPVFAGRMTGSLVWGGRGEGRGEARGALSCEGKGRGQRTAWGSAECGVASTVAVTRASQKKLHAALSLQFQFAERRGHTSQFGSYRRMCRGSSNGEEHSLAAFPAAW
jgi:hypothetical protein